MDNLDLYYMEYALKEAKKSYFKNEIPVGVVIVQNNKIIARAHNLRDSKKIVTRHAEIIAIEKANKKMNNWRLNDCIMYSTLKPCEMCMAVINNSKIKKVIYAADATDNCNHKKNVTEVKQIDNNLIKDRCSQIIKDAFIKIRNKKV